MAAVGKNVKVDTYAIFCKVVDSHKNVHEFCAKNDLSYVTFHKLFNDDATTLRAETLIKVASALGCSVMELIAKGEVLKKKEKKVKQEVADPFVFLGI
jgi:DNA-binding Xre family transcriptional regulator